jgi:hypothetical protein
MATLPPANKPRSKDTNKPVPIRLRPSEVRRRVLNAAYDGVLLQMLALARAFRGPAGTMIKALLGEAQFDPELADAFRRHWLLPRRQAATEAIQAAIDSGVLRPDIDIERTLDALYGGAYYRLLTGLGPLSKSYMEGIFTHVMEGVRAEPLKAAPHGSRKTHEERQR